MICVIVKQNKLQLNFNFKKDTKLIKLDIERQARMLKFVRNDQPSVNKYFNIEKQPHDFGMLEEELKNLSYKCYESRLACEQKRLYYNFLSTNFHQTLHDINSKQKCNINYTKTNKTCN